MSATKLGGRKENWGGLGPPGPSLEPRLLVTRQIERRLNIFFGVRVPQPYYFGSTRTPGHLILGVWPNFLAYITPVLPLTEAMG